MTEPGQNPSQRQRCAVRSQFGASIDMLDNAMQACPDELWSDRSQQPEFWYLVYHTLFWLDLYLSSSLDEFSPPLPFNLDELDPSGVMPDRVYTKSELHEYLQHGRVKCMALIDSLTDEHASRRCGFAWVDCSVEDLLLYNMRHVQHGAAQLNLILRRETGSAPQWMKRAQMS